MAVDFTILNNFNNTIRQLQDSINVSIQQSIKANEQVVKQLQTEQLYSGTTNKGDDIKPFYADSTIKRKRRKGQPFDRVTLKDTGDFYDSLNLIIGNNAMFILAEISYSFRLIDRYENILGLTTENWQSFIDEYTLPTIKRNFDDIIARS